MDRMDAFTTEGSGYLAIQNNRPQTIGYGLADSPLLQLAWIAEKVREWTDLPVDRDQLLTTVSLSHKDRTRLMAGDRSAPLPPGNGAADGTFLVDGMWQGTWQIRGGKLRLQPFTKLRLADRDSLLAEAAQLAAFAAGQPCDIILGEP
jgi:hypothetical protein